MYYHGLEVSASVLSCVSTLNICTHDVFLVFVCAQLYSMCVYSIGYLQYMTDVVHNKNEESLL